MKKLICIIIAVIFIVPFTVGAIDSTEEHTAGQNIYIAGNPDMYPLEYYNEKSKNFEGILPELYGDISKQTGIKISYIEAGTKNIQNRLAKNLQAEIISAHYKGDIEGLVQETVLFSFKKDGKNIDVAIGFTDIANENTVSQINLSLERISTKDIMRCSMALSDDYRTVPLWIGIMFVVLVVLITVALIIYLIVRKKRKKIKKNLKFTDPLTGIGNKEFFKYGFENYISEDNQTLYYTAYIAYDNEKIKKYYGDKEAETIQIYSADILSNALRDSDFAARINDGVFAIEFLSYNDEDAKLYIKNILNTLNGYEQKYAKEFKLDYRCGLYRLTLDKITPETAVYNARQGYIYAIKENKDICFCDKSMISSQEKEERLHKRLNDAIKKEEIKLYLQFIVDSKTGRICAAEALSRWHSPEEGVVSPLNYINDMINAGIIHKLDFYIFDKVCKKISEWQNTKYRNLSISCNFTRITVSRVDFVEKIREISSKYKIDCSKIIIEITEDSLADNNALAKENIHECKKMNFTIALDDMGMGYTSFGDFYDYPIDTVKIDKSIVDKSLGEQGSGILNAIIRFSHDLGMRVLCEGIENEKSSRIVTEAGCDFIQGFYYSRVLPEDNAMHFYDKYTKQFII